MNQGYINMTNLVRHNASNRNRKERNRLYLFTLSLLLLLLCVNAGAAQNALKNVTYNALPGNNVQVVLEMEGVVAAPSSFSTDNPARIALDFSDTANLFGQKNQPVGIGQVRSITAIEASGRTRVVVNLVSAVDYDLSIDGTKVFLNIGGGNASSPSIVQASSAVSSSSQSQATKATAVASQRAVQSVDFRRGDTGEGRVMLQLNDASAVVDMREEGGRIVLDILNASVPVDLERKFDVSDFATPVKMFEVTGDGKNVHVEISTVGEYEHLAYQADELYTVEFRPLTKAEKEELKRRQETFTGDRLSLNFQDIEVRSVLQLLADFTGLNLVTSDTVTGRITLRLKNVPWDQALDIILKTRGLSMRQNGNVVLIAPTEEIAAREKLELESQQQIEELAPLYSEYIQINYAKAKDIQELLKSPDNQLITPGRGNVTVDERTNTLLIRDTAAKLDDIRRLIDKLDVPVRQVLIESRVVIANDDFAKDVGVRFGFNTDGSFRDESYAIIGGGMEGYLGNTFGLAPGIENPAGSGQEALLVNLPQTLSSSRGGALNLIVGRIGSYLLQLELSAMQQEGRGEIISSPRVITSDQHKAVIKQGIEVPYQEASSSGATSVSFKEAVLKLDVTPHITPDDRVIMDLVVNKDSPDFSRAVLGVPPVDTRSVETSVLVDNGETVVLGGVFERTAQTTRESIPFFGDLPVVGNLFQQRGKRDENKELLIFVTPKILKDSLSVR